MKGIKRIIGWAKQYTFLFVFIVLISVLLQWLYSPSGSMTASA